MAKLTDEEKKLKTEQKAAQNAEELAKAQNDGQEAAEKIVTVNGENVHYEKASDLDIWSDNPRTPAETVYEDAALRDSVRAEWSPQYPAVIFPNMQVIQGNRRLSFVDPDSMVPCITYTGDPAGAMLLALNDTGTGIVEKGLGDITRAVVGIMIDLGLTDHTIVAYMWTRAREILHRISPASKQAGTIQEAQKASRGALQAVSKIAKLSQEHQDGAYAERNTGTTKGKRYPNDVIAKMATAGVGEASEKIFAEHLAKQEAKSDPAEQAKPSKLTARLMSDRRAIFKSEVFKALGALFDKAEEGAERDALAELAELDATCSARE